MPSGYATLPGWPAAKRCSRARRSSQPSTDRPTRRRRARWSPASIEAHPDVADELVEQRAPARRLGRAGVCVAVAVVGGRRRRDACSTRSAIPTRFAASGPSTTTARRGTRRRSPRDERGLRRWKRESCCASRPATCSASPTSPPSGASWPRSRRCASAAALADRGEPSRPVRGDRDGQARRARAQLRERRRRAVRARRRQRGRRARAARRCSAMMTEPTADGIVFRTDADLRPEGRVGRAQPHARQLRGRTRSGGRRRGSSRR